MKDILGNLAKIAVEFYLISLLIILIYSDFIIPHSSSFCKLLLFYFQMKEVIRMPSEYELPYLGGRLMSTQVSALLIKELKEGAFSAAERLPSEVELAERLGVSRTVIRDALSDLEREGFIERVRGIGTVINREIVGLKHRLDLKLEYNELIRDAGYRPGVDSISRRVEPADEELAEILQIDSGAPAIVCEKRLLASGTPVIYSVDYLPKALLEGMNYADIDWSMPVFDILDRYCGLTVVTSIAKLRATNADPLIRSRLEAAKGDALIMLDEIGFCKLSRPVMRSFEFYTDFFDFTLLRKKF